MGAITGILCDKAKQVTSVELSKQRASAIETRCQEKDNLEIIVGNFNDIKFDKKFDYITLIGVLEYAPLYTNTDNPFHDFLVQIKSLLKENGKLLIAIENQYGMKYFSGIPEDHTGKVYDGITGYDVSANYAPAIVNSEYILFLRKYDGDFELYKDTYIIQYYEKGKYLVSNNLKKMRTNISDYVDSLSNEELNIGYNASKVYRNIYKTVIDKYISNTTVSNMENIKPQENTNVSKNEEESAKEIIQSVSLGENQAINKNGNVLIPISTAAELLNCKIDWNAYSKTAFMKRDDIIAEFPINQSYYILNGIQYNTNTQVELYNQRTYISLSIINEIFDTEIVYDSFNNTITLAH